MERQRSGLSGRQLLSKPRLIFRVKFKTGGGKRQSIATTSFDNIGLNGDVDSCLLKNDNGRVHLVTGGPNQCTT
jgi:hypothetical protein